MVLFIEKSKTKLIFRKQKCPLNIQKISSQWTKMSSQWTKLSVRIFYKINFFRNKSIYLQMQMLLPFSLQRIERVRVWGIGSWLVISGIVSYRTNFLLNQLFIDYWISFFFITVAVFFETILFLSKTRKNRIRSLL